MKPPAQYFRAGVGAAIANAEGLVLAMERSDIPGAWQLPQGGLEAGEEPGDGVQREVFEETGIGAERLELVTSLREPLVYELPSDARTAKTGRGQVQYWFLFRFHGSDGEIAPGREFRNWQWMSFDELLKSVAAFRRGVYAHLATWFGEEKGQ